MLRNDSKYRQKTLIDSQYGMVLMRTGDRKMVSLSLEDVPLETDFYATVIPENLNGIIIRKRFYEEGFVIKHFFDNVIECFIDLCVKCLVGTLSDNDFIVVFRANIIVRDLDCDVQPILGNLDTCVSNESPYDVIKKYETASKEYKIPQLESFKWEQGAMNPCTYSICISKSTDNSIEFKCPTCRFPNIISLNDIDDESGALYICEYCKNISHIPTESKMENEYSKLAIFGSVYMHINDFGKWLFFHPLFSRDNVDVYGSYGLWIFCASCEYQYTPSVLPAFIFHCHGLNIELNTKTQKSTKDWNALHNGACPSCGSPYLLSLLVPIPQIILERHKNQQN